METNTEHVVVLGSKPEALLPAVPAKYVFAANNAVEVATAYRSKYDSRIIATAAADEIRKHAHIQDSFKKAQPDEIVLFGGHEKEYISLIQDELGLQIPVTVLSMYERNRGLLRTIGWRRFTLIADLLYERGLVHALTRGIPDLLHRADTPWLYRSTGVNAIMYAHTRFPSADIIVAGVGLIAGAHFSGIGEFKEKTAKADRATMRHWPQSTRSWLSTTDEALASIGGVSKWNGGIFHYNG